MSAGRRAGLVAAAPVVFVLLWSTGFVVAHYATADAGPMTFLGLRTAVAAVVLAVIALVTRAPRPTREQVRWMGVTAMGLHVVYLGGVFVAIDHGLPSGVSALISGLHPVLTSVLAGPLLGERLARRQWIGVALGFGGVAVVVADLLAHKGAHIGGVALVASALGVVGMSSGSLLQRRHGGSVPLLWGTAVQYAASAVAFLTGAVLVEHWRLHVTTRFVLSFVWAVVVLSIAAVLLMLFLLQREAAARVSTLFFLTPALSTIEGAILFHERLRPPALAGLAVALVGVAVALRRRAEPGTIRTFDSQVLAPDEV